MHSARSNMQESPQMDLRIVSAGYLEAPQGHDYPSHLHANWELCYYRRGTIRCPIGTQVHTAVPGTLLVTPPRTRHAEWADTAYANCYIGIVAPPDRPWPTLCVDDMDHVLATTMLSVVREYQRATPEREEMLALLARQLDLLLCRAASASPHTEREKVVVAAEQIMAEGLATRIRIEEVAQRVGLSPSGLRATFLRQRGRTPQRILHELRLQQTLALLHTSTLPLEAIAGLCGFDSASHLSRTVKLATGNSPRTWRALSSNG